MILEQRETGPTRLSQVLLLPLLHTHRATQERKKNLTGGFQLEQLNVV